MHKLKLSDYRSRGMMAILLLLLFTCQSIADETAVPPVEMILQQVAEHSWYVQGAAGVATDNEGFISNAGVVITGQGVVVFDALGSPALARLLIKRIREITRQPIVKVIVSHYHADHIYGLQEFVRLGATIIAPEGSLKYLESDAARERLEERRFSLDPWVNDETELVVADELLTQGTTFELGGLTFTLNLVGAAHSDADLTMLVEPDRVLYSGDILFEGRVPFLGDGDTADWLQVLQRLEATGLTALVPGHGAAAADPAKVISGTRRYLAYLRQTMGAAVEELIPFDEVYAESDWSEFEQLPAFDAAHRRNAYQVYLSLEAEALE